MRPEWQSAAFKFVERHGLWFRSSNHPVFPQQRHRYSAKVETVFSGAERRFASRAAKRPTPLNKQLKSHAACVGSDMAFEPKLELFPQPW
jgi:hypothetical protein